MTRAWQYIGLIITLIAIAAQGVRWLRVLQREHYEPEAVARFFLRWAFFRLPSPSNRNQIAPSRLLGDWPIAAAFCVALVLIHAQPAWPHAKHHNLVNIRATLLIIAALDSPFQEL